TDRCLLDQGPIVYLWPLIRPDMKKILGLVLCLCLLACEGGSKLAHEPLKMEGETCDQCPDIQVGVPHMLDGSQVAEAINRALSEEIISILSFSEGEPIDNVEKAIASFTQSYRELRDRFDYELPWEASVKGRVVHEDERIVTLEVNSYSFTGGAHGYASTSYLNFDKKNGRELDNVELFSDLPGFQE